MRPSSSLGGRSASAVAPYGLDGYEGIERMSTLIAQPGCATGACRRPDPTRPLRTMSTTAGGDGRFATKPAVSGERLDPRLSALSDEDRRRGSRSFPAAGRVQIRLAASCGRGPCGATRLDGVDDLGVVDALEVDGGDAEVGSAGRGSPQRALASRTARPVGIWRERTDASSALRRGATPVPRGSSTNRHRTTRPCSWRWRTGSRAPRRDRTAGSPDRPTTTCRTTGACT
jgi:hypothetical protein